MKNFLLVSACIVLPIVAGFAAEIESAKLVSYEKNPGGFDTGFWANYHMSPEIVRDFGPRPLERVNFHKWYQHEKKQGTFDFDDVFKWEEWGHLAGSTIIANVNTFFTRKLNPDGMGAIPAWYPQDIQNPETRKAARRYLKAFTRALLKQTGTVWLTLDYEMFWFALPTKPEIRTAYRDWFVESAALCRQVAIEMGRAEQIKIGFIANTDPYDTAGHSLGSPAGPHHKRQKWVLDCIAAADFVGLDTYAGGAEGIVTPEHQLRAMRFWIENYAGDKPFYVTESGFTTSVQEGDTRRGYHIRGTEAQQAEFFTAMLQALTAARRDAADPLSKVRGYLIWNYADRGEEDDLVERHFGLTRLDGSRKPAHEAVAVELARIDSDPTLSPCKIHSEQDVSDAVVRRIPFQMRREGGHRFDAIELKFTPTREGPHRLVVESSIPICLLVRINGKTWITNHPDASTTSALALPPLGSGTPVVIEIQPTAAKYPLETRIIRLEIQPIQP